jgi:hypothetical protein
MGKTPELLEINAQEARREARRLLDAAKTTEDAEQRHDMLARALKLAVLAEEMERRQ